ncbi:MAG: HPr family phosphocarrier protein [Acidimicrobiales bacterium]
MTTAQDQILARESVFLGLTATTKEDAIRHVGGVLVERGHVDPAYVDGMLTRELTVSTLLGNGVAMPHGTFESRDAVHGTGIVVAQYPEGIDWGEGTAHLVIGLAATGEDHVTILSHMAEVLQDEEVAEQLWTTGDLDLLHSTLSVVPGGDDDDDVVERTIQISGEGGLHARPASLIVEYAKTFDGTIEIAKDGKSAKANSIMGVLALGAVANDTVTVKVDGGEDSEAAADEIARILTTPEAEL